MKVVICDGIESVCSSLLKERGFSVEEVPAGTTPPYLTPRLADAEVLLVRSATQVSAELIASAPTLKIIGRAGAGVDNIDVDAATRRGILVMNTPGGNTIATAEHTMALLLSLMRLIPQANTSLRAGKWERKKFVGSELQGKTIGILGIGKVGREVASRCAAFGMRVLGFDPFLPAEAIARYSVTPADVPTILREADIITVHTPLSDATRNLIGEKELGHCKKGVRIINCARGGIVDEEALLNALDNGTVAGAAFDVFVQEPPGDHPLIKHPHVIATPHLGASTEEAQEKVARQIAEQIADMVEGKSVVGAVNAEHIDLLSKPSIAPVIRLAELLGVFASQYPAQQISSINVTVAGEESALLIRLATSAVVRGILSRRYAEELNYINIRYVARENGLQISEVAEESTPPYTLLISVRYSSGKETHVIRGTMFNPQSLRIVEIDDQRIEFEPVGNLLVYRNVDKPGVLSRVSSILADAGINIARVSLGRDKPGENALTVMGIDSDLPIKVLGEVSGVQGVRSAQTLKF